MAQLKVTVNAKGAKAGADEFRASLASMTGAAKQFESALSGMTKSAQSASKNLSSSFSAATTAANGLRSAMVALGALNLGGSIVGTIASYEGLKSALITATKSTEGAEAAFQKLKVFAEQTPFTLEEATKGYIRMASAGLKPSIEALTDFGDIASAIPGKTILDFVEAVADGTQGQGRRLKEFGIDLNNQGEQVELVFGGMKTLVNNDAKSIEEGIRSISRANFGGSMERQSKTLAGQWAQLSDKAASLAMEIGEGGLLPAMKDFVKELTKAADGSKSAAQSLGSVLGTAVRATSAVLVTLANNMGAVKLAFIAVATYTAVSMVPAITAAIVGFQSLVGVVSIAIVSMGGFRAAMIAAALANPFTAAALAIAAVVTGLYTIISYWDEISAKISSWVPPQWADAAAGQDNTYAGSAFSDSMGYYDEGPDIAAENARAESLRQMAIHQDEMNVLVGKGIVAVRDYATGWSFVGKEVKESAFSLDSLTAAGKRLDKSLTGGAFGQTYDAVTSPTFKSNVERLAREKEAAARAAEQRKKEQARELADLRKHLQDTIDAWREHQTKLAELRGQADESYKAFLIEKLQKDAAAYITPETLERDRKLIEANEKKQKEAERLANYQSPMQQWVKDYADATKAAEKFNEVALSGLNQFSSTLATALIDGKADWAGFYKSMQKEVLELIIKMLIATAVKAALGGATGGFSNAFFSAASGLGGITGAAYHDGGVVGAGGTPRAVNPAWFSNAPRFHSGTIPALKGDELPAILQRGEVVLTEKQASQAGKGGRTVVMHNYFPDVKDSRGFGRGMAQEAARWKRKLEEVE